MRSEQSTREKLRDVLRSRRGSSEEWCQDRHSLGWVVAVRKKAMKNMLVGQSSLETRAKKWETNESSSLSTGFLSTTSYSSFPFHPSETAILRTGLMTPTSLTSLVTSVNGCWVAKSSSARTAVVSSRVEGRGGVRGRLSSSEEVISVNRWVLGVMLGPGEVVDDTWTKVGWRYCTVIRARSSIMRGAADTGYEGGPAVKPSHSCQATMIQLVEQGGLD